LKDIYIRENNTKIPVKELTEERIARKCQKLAFVFREPALNFVELVRQHPDMRAYQLVELKRNGVPSKVEEIKPTEVKISEVKVEEKKEVAEPVKIEAPVKPESIVYVKEITDDDLFSSAIKDSIPVKKVEEPKPVAIAEVKLTNKLDEREIDFKTKNELLQELIAIAGEDNDYVSFVRKNYKQGADACLNLWFESQN